MKLLPSIPVREVERPREETVKRVVVGQQFVWGGRLFEVVKSYGEHDRSPVIIMEHNPRPPALPGQYGLWAVHRVEEAIREWLEPPRQPKRARG